MTPEKLREACETIIAGISYRMVPTDSERVLLREVARECLSLLPDALRWRAMCKMTDGDSAMPVLSVSGLERIEPVRGMVAFTAIRHSMDAKELTRAIDDWIAEEAKAGRGSE